jgi:hypothetical protein
MIRQAASTHSGPMPSPGIKVTRVLSFDTPTVVLLLLAERDAPVASVTCYPGLGRDRCPRSTRV